jgi:acyl-CoA reductase-like NAD-dependent aldehyde dehydrogenase
MLHLPLLRQGVAYRSLDIARVPHHRTGEPFVEVSQANAGLIRRDVLNQEAARRALAALPAKRLLAICGEAADRFMGGRLPLGDDRQSPQDYIEQLSATTGMPFVLVRRNMQKIAAVLQNVETILRGLTRGLDLDILDRGFGELDGQALSFFPRTRALGVVLPSNSPGVHGLWVPAIPLKVPLVLRPGSAEPWTPVRLAQAFIAAGCPREAFSYYPSDHAGAGEILRRCGRSMFFGDVTAVGAWEGDPRIELHGPGYSKVAIARDRVDDWSGALDLTATSIVQNGGRSCVNASGVWVPVHGREIAEALAERLAAILPLPSDDERAQLAPFADPRVAERISQQIDQGLSEPGATEVTAELRRGGRLVTTEDGTYLLPTIVHCERPDHPLANREFLFPYAAVVRAPQETWPEAFGPTLVLTAITAEPDLTARLLESDLVGRLNVGPIPTTQIAWDQPHEGNLFEHLYGRRAFQRSRDLVVS